jgi:hypothetical protein
MPPALAWCLRDLPRGYELTQSEAAASLGVTPRQLRRDEIAVRAKLQALPAARRLASEFGFLPRATGGCAPDVRSTDENVQSVSRAPRTQVPWSPSPPSVSGVGLRASGHLSRRKVRPMIDCTSAAERVSEIERLPLGDAAATAQMTEAAAAIAAERLPAELQIFPPDLTPVTADSIAAWTMHTQRIGGTAHGYGERLADLHRRAVTSHPQLAAMCRSVEGLDDVAAAAGSLAFPGDRETHAQAAARATAAATARYRLAIAQHIADVPGHELGDAARRLLALATLAVRLDAARQRHEEHAKLEAERAAAERAAAQLEADRAIDAAEMERLLGEANRVHGLPQTLRDGIFVEAQRERLAVYVPLVRRLKSSRVDAVRLARGYYAPANLAISIADVSITELQAIVTALDRAEGKAVPS